MGRIATPGVLIDACIPRSGLERIDVLLDYFEGMHDSTGHAEVYASLLRSRTTCPEEHANELEDEILSCINAKLPNELVCTLGEFQPGDVMIREIDEDDYQGPPSNDGASNFRHGRGEF